MTLRRMEHIGIVVDDHQAAIDFFAELGLELQGKMPVEGPWVDRINGLEGVRVDTAMMRAPDGSGQLELIKYHSPPAEDGDGNAPGIRHIAFLVDDIEASLAGLRTRGAELVGEVERYENSYLLCYVRGPAGIIVELAEKLG